MSSSDGFCSTVAFAPGELGQTYSGPIPTAHHSHHHSLSIGTNTSAQPSPLPTPTGSAAPSFSRIPSSGGGNFASPVPNYSTASPNKSRSNSVSSAATQSSHAPPTAPMIGNSPTPTMGTVPGITASNSVSGGLPLSTPPMTPMSTSSVAASTAGATFGKRESNEVKEAEQDEPQPKRRRIAPTPVNDDALATGQG